ncbi:MAG: [FeFe] hydrogenase H-cluster radical SAM maturase HydG, partial [Candidatus Zixiibacteriota bacterium]
MRVDDGVIARQLARAEAADAGQVRDTLARARAARGLTGEEASVLFNVDDRDLLADLFAAAREVKEGIYGRRLVLFAPLYISNLCANECVYCAFRARNPAVARRALSREEIEEEVRALVTRGH